MITLHKLNKVEFIINDNHIETIEETPDSVITLTNDRKYIVTESADEIVSKIIEYQQKIHKKMPNKD
jgi:flagellar protein FlbD